MFFLPFFFFYVSDCEEVLMWRWTSLEMDGWDAALPWGWGGEVQAERARSVGDSGRDGWDGTDSADVIDVE